MLLTKCVHQMQNTMEHLGLTHADDTLSNTRSTRTSAFFRWIAWNMQYHTAHHTFPAVPFHALPQLHREIVAMGTHERHAAAHLIAPRPYQSGQEIRGFRRLPERRPIPNLDFVTLAREGGKHTSQLRLEDGRRFSPEKMLCVRSKRTC